MDSISTADGYGSLWVKEKYYNYTGKNIIQLYRKLYTGKVLQLHNYNTQCTDAT